MILLRKIRNTDLSLFPLGCCSYFYRNNRTTGKQNKVIKKKIWTSYKPDFGSTMWRSKDHRKTEVRKRWYRSYFCWKQNDRLTVIRCPNIKNNCCKLTTPFKKNFYDNLIINFLLDTRDIRLGDKFFSLKKK